MNKAKCPMCSADVKVPANAKLGQIIFCDQCDAELEIVNLQPVELDWPLEELEDDDLYEYEMEGDDYDDDDDDPYDDD